MSHSQFRCIILILRHAWLSLWDKHMATGRINQITIVKRPSRGKPQECAGVSFINIISSWRQRRHSGLVAPRLGAFMNRNQLGVHSQSTNGRPKCSFPVDSFEANLPPPGRYARGRSRICTQVDSHTLFTHNDTIIFCSLNEGLTYSLCAQHAETVCHKKDSCVGGISQTISTRSFTFLFTATDSAYAD